MSYTIQDLTASMQPFLNGSFGKIELLKALLIVAAQS